MPPIRDGERADTFEGQTCHWRERSLNSAAPFALLRGYVACAIAHESDASANPIGRGDCYVETRQNHLTRLGSQGSRVCRGIQPCPLFLSFKVTEREASIQNVYIMSTNIDCFSTSAYNWLTEQDFAHQSHLLTEPEEVKMSPTMAKKRKKKATRMVRLDLDQYKLLKKWAEEQDRSLTRELKRIIAEFLRSVGRTGGRGETSS